MALPFHATCKRHRVIVNGKGTEVSPLAAQTVAKRGGEVVQCDLDTDDRETFERHMAEVHHRRKMRGPDRGKAYPWKAPKAPEGTSKLAAVLAAAGDDVTDVSGVEGFLTEGTFRYDRDELPALDSLPATVRPIVAGAAARGEMWLVHLEGARARVEVGRKGEDGRAVAGAKIELWQGRVRKAYAMTEGARYLSEARIAYVKAMFPAA